MPISEAAAAGPAPVFYRTSLPKPTGVYSVGYDSIVVVDRTRVDALHATPGQPRRLPVHLWYPAAATCAPKRRYVTDVRERTLLDATPEALGAGDFMRTNAVNGAPVAIGSFPLVLFSPGYGFSAEIYQVFAEQLASCGYIVAAVHSPGINGLVTSDGEPYETPSDIPGSGEESKQISIVLNDYVVGDLQAVLAQIKDGRALPSRQLAKAIDLTRIGAFGHSFGGSAAVRLAGKNPEVRAAVNMDGIIWGDDHLNGLTTNALFLVSGQPGGDSSMMDAWQNLKGRGYLAVQKETAHITFSDFYYLARATSGKAAEQATDVLGRNPAANLALTRQLLVTYFDVELKQKPASTLLRFFDANKARISFQRR